MRVREKNGILNFLKMIFIDVDCPDEEVDIEKSEDPKMQELKESLSRVDTLERSFYVSNSAPKGGKSKGIVERAEVDTAKAVEAAEKRETTKGKEGREI
ncbi:MAG: hypothetical protein HFJ32_02450 [Clostridia bacterium]|nr:hypothetical protein [Clostridia bacterium]